MRKTNQKVTGFGMLVVLTLLLMLAGFGLAAGEPAARKGGPSADPQPSERQDLEMKTAALAEFDNDVARCRRKMRDYCAIAQELMAKPESEAGQRSSLALKHLRETKSQWKVIQTKYRNNPPAEYANDPKFADRLSEIANSMEAMEQQLTAGRFKQSFAACGHGCGLFVQMHEHNGLVYALDRIYHLRKVAKAAITAGKNKGALAVGEFLPDLLHHRNRIVTAPCPWPDDKQRCNNYRDSVNTLSSMLNDLAASVVNRDLSEIDRILKVLFRTINSAYGKAL
ncbi:hypothetical protein J7M28_12250 [bacterium]|nr:hypothetical protein [bacterium]